MVENNSALAVQYVRLIAEQLRRLDVPLEHWYALSGLDPAQLDDPAFVLGLDTFFSLSRDARRLSDEPALGLLVGRRLGVRAHGALGYAAMNSRTIRDVLGLLQRYIGLRIALLALSVQTSAREVRVVLDELVPLGDVRTMILEGVVCSIHNVLQDVSTGVCQVEAVAFPFADPGHRAQAEALLRCPVAYGESWAGLVLSPRVLDVPLRMSDPRAFRLAEELCDRELRAIERRRTWTARVQRVLLDTRVGFPTLDEAARRLHTSPRTLHRRLGAEGTSFREVLDAMRERSACDQLRRGDATVDEIAYILGYHDTANFRRAFRRWTGTSPGRYRKAQIAR